MGESSSRLPKDVSTEVFSYLDEDDKVNVAFAGISDTQAKLWLSYRTFSDIGTILPKLVGVKVVDMDDDDSWTASTDVFSVKGYCSRGFETLCLLAKPYVIEAEIGATLFAVS